MNLNGIKALFSYSGQNISDLGKAGDAILDYTWRSVWEGRSVEIVVAEEGEALPEELTHPKVKDQKGGSRKLSDVAKFTLRCAASVLVGLPCLLGLAMKAIAVIKDGRDKACKEVVEDFLDLKSKAEELAELEGKEEKVKEAAYSEKAETDVFKKIEKEKRYEALKAKMRDVDGRMVLLRQEIERDMKAYAKIVGKEKREGQSTSDTTSAGIRLDSDEERVDDYEAQSGGEIAFPEARSDDKKSTPSADRIAEEISPAKIPARVIPRIRIKQEDREQLEVLLRDDIEMIQRVIKLASKIKDDIEKNPSPHDFCDLLVGYGSEIEMIKRDHQLEAEHKLEEEREKSVLKKFLTSEEELKLKETRKLEEARKLQEEVLPALGLLLKNSNFRERLQGISDFLDPRSKSNTSKDRAKITRVLDIDDYQISLVSELSREFIRFFRSIERQTEKPTDVILEKLLDDEQVKGLAKRIDANMTQKPSLHDFCDLLRGYQVEIDEIQKKHSLSLAEKNKKLLLAICLLQKNPDFKAKIQELKQLFDKGYDTTKQTEDLMLRLGMDTLDELFFVNKLSSNFFSVLPSIEVE